MSDNPLQERFAETLLDRISEQRYPSVTHMDMLEEIAPPALLVAYTLHLIDRVEQDVFPSIPMMKRVQRLVARWGLELAPA